MKFRIALLLLLAGSFGWFLNYALSPTPKPTPEQLGTVFFRMIVKFEYKGEPQTFDYVAGCHVLDVADLKTGELRYAGFIPAIYGQKMKDGKAVVVRTPDFCHGQTSTAGIQVSASYWEPPVPKEFMPFIIVYDDAERMDEGLGYFSSDAYDSPYSDLKFISTEVREATRGDFDRDGITEGKPNAVTRQLYWAGQGTENMVALGFEPLRPSRTAVGKHFIRYKIPEAARAIIRQAWPQSRPEYWIDYDKQELLAREVMKGAISEDEAGYYMVDKGPVMRQSHLEYGMARRGMRAQTDDHINYKQKVDWANMPLAAYYPMFSDYTERNVPGDLDNWLRRFPNPSAIRIGFEDRKWRGFVGCWKAPVLAFRSTGNDGRNPAFEARILSTDIQVWVDKVPVDFDPKLRRYLLPDVLGLLVVFERDEFLWRKENFDFGKAGGDVK
jgi:hypothetical protein